MAQEKNNTVGLLGAALVAFSLWGDRLPFKLPDLGLGGGTTVTFETPDATLQQKVESIRSILANAQRSDKDALAYFYLRYAELVVPNEKVLKSNSQLRNGLMIAADTNFQGRLKGKYAGLADAVDKALIAMVGEKVTTFDATSRQRAAAALKAIAWACHS